MHDGLVLDISKSELKMYRLQQETCEICGQAERRIGRAGTATKLCIDHEHGSGRFRGLLCADCNRKLGWFEKYQDQIARYLHKGK